MLKSRYIVAARKEEKDGWDEDTFSNRDVR